MPALPHDRLNLTQYPVAAKGQLKANAGDYEQLLYDAAGNVASRRLRDGQVIGYAYDALGRVITKDLPGTEPSAAYAYDLLGRLTQASQDGATSVFVHDALGRLVAQNGPHGWVNSAYDAAGRRTALLHADGFRIEYDHLVTGEVRSIREAGATSGPGVLATFGYDDLGRRTSLTRGNGTTTAYAYDPASRLASLSHDVAICPPFRVPLTIKPPSAPDRSRR